MSRNELSRGKVEEEGTKVMEDLVNKMKDMKKDLAAIQMKLDLSLGVQAKMSWGSLGRVSKRRWSTSPLSAPAP